MRIEQINKPIKEFRNVVTPKDEAHYREMMKHLQDMELDPVNRRDENLMAEIRRRRMELRNWAEKNIKRESEPSADAERVDIAQGMWMASKELQAKFRSWEDFLNSEDFDEYIQDQSEVPMLDPEFDEGFIGKKPEYTDFLQNKLDTAMQEYDTPEKKAQRDALMKQYLAKGGKVQKVPTGQTAYKGKELKPAFKKDKNGTPITSPGSDESVEEDAPFDGKGILQRAVFNKWISAEEWYHLKDEWQDAARELEQRYSDWPDGEGFGSSDHNFAIRDLMSIVGYEFDDQDTSGKFVVTKMPEKLEKLGITNVRMRGEPVKEAPIEQDRDNPIAKPYVDTPEWKALHDMDDKIIQAYIKHKESAVQELDDKERTMSTIKHSSDKNVAFFDKMMKRYGPKLMELIIDYAHTISNNEQKGKEKLKKWGREGDIYLSDYYHQLKGVDEDLITLLHRSVDTNPKLIDFFYDKVEQAKKAGQFAKTSRLPDPDTAVDIYASEEDGVQPADLKRLGQHEPKVYVHKDGKTILISKKDANHYISKGWKKSALRAETSYESKLADMLNQRLK